MFDAEEEIEGGDYLMVVRNNYFWLPKDSEIGFLANGDFLQITKIIRREEMYGFHFAQAQVRLGDYPDEPELEVKLLLDTLHTETPALPSDRNNALYQAVSADYADLKTKAERYKQMRQDPYLNALQIKFAYAPDLPQGPGRAVASGVCGPRVSETRTSHWRASLPAGSTRPSRGPSERLFLLNFQAQLVAE